MKKLILSLMMSILSMHCISSTYANKGSSDQVALLQLHRFNQLQMQMAKMAKTKSKKEEVKELANKLYEVHRTTSVVNWIRMAGWCSVNYLFCI